VCRLVSREWLALSDDETLWRAFYATHLGPLAAPPARVYVCDQSKCRSIESLKRRNVRVRWCVCVCVCVCGGACACACSE
jgi:hypothetical protein